MYGSVVCALLLNLHAFRTVMVSVCIISNHICDITFTEIK